MGDMDYGEEFRRPQVEGDYSSEPINLTKSYLPNKNYLLWKLFAHA